MRRNMANKKATKKTSAKNVSSRKTKVTSNAKKPVYEQPWFWIVVVLVAIAIIGYGASPKNQDTNDGTDTSSSSSNTNEGGDVSNNSAQKDVYAIGDTIVVKKSEYKVVSVQRNYDTGNMFVQPGDGYEFVKVNIQIRNLDKSEEHYYASDFELIDGNGVVRSYSFMATSLLDNGLNNVALTSGGNLTAAIVFEVPKGDTALILRKKSSILGIEQFKVKV